MFGNFNYKINTALLISLAFIFRLAFINISLSTAYNPSNNSKVLAFQPTTVNYNGSASKVSTQKDFKNFGAIEVCDEDCDNEEDLIKTNFPTSLSTFFSFFNDAYLIPKSNFDFDVIKCNLYPKRHLAFSILRV